MSTQALFQPLQVGPCALAHRVVMAPLTRMRATVPGHVANALNAQYYGQRASAGGLIIAEASQVLPGGGGTTTPGIHTQEQLEGWKGIVEAIHAKGGSVFLQLWHMGRVSHSSNQPGGVPPIAPSAIAASGMTMTAKFTREPFETPRALRTDEIPGVIDAYAQAARHAMAAGFDGVEVHSANGYLLEQFMQSASNQRTDQYGGSIANRARLALEVTAAVARVCGAHRVGIRLSPFGVANSSGEADPMPLYSHVIGELDKMGLAYLHLIEPRASGAGQGEVDHQGVPSAAELFRSAWHGVLIAAGNFRGDSAADMVARGSADAIGFGRLFISNPDLPRRLQREAALTPYNRATFYSRGPEGYIDYPEMESA